MKKVNKIPRILKIEAINGLKIVCIFNNGELREINFESLFKQWNVSANDPEFKLLNPNEFKKVTLRNQTLSWENVLSELTDFEGNCIKMPYELSPDVLYQNSSPINEFRKKFDLGTIIRKSRKNKGLTQQALANLSGTSKTYISRVENNLIEPELSTLYKIVELGLGKKVKVEII
ncbi:MAG: helix-turn-helix domain-containing protein [Chitinophagaceae bacterium]